MTKGQFNFMCAVTAALVFYFSTLSGCALPTDGDEETIDVTAGEEPFTAAVNQCGNFSFGYWDAFANFKLIIPRVHGEEPRLISGPAEPAPRNNFVRQIFQAKAPYGQQGQFQYWTTNTVRNTYDEVTRFQAITKRNQYFSPNSFTTTWGSIDCDCARSPTKTVCQYVNFPQGW